MRRPLVFLLLCVLPVLAQNNILNNGGFETGLMCYTDWIWSVTGIDFRGDYHFSLSNDAHSGAYSLQIACGGTDCLRAAAISGRIPSPANQSYLLSVYAKCPVNNPGRSNYVYAIDGPIPNNAVIVTAPLTCDGTWHQNLIPFQNGPADGYLFFYLVNADTSWLLVDDVVLTYGDGTAPAHTSLHSGLRNVSISGQNVMVDGAPFLSLGFFDVGYNDLAQVAATGANTINSLPYYNAADCFNTGQTSYLDRAYELGLNFLPDSSTTARLFTPSVLSSAAQTFAPHLANIGWFLSDEPDLIEIPMEYIPPSTFIAEYAGVKANTSLPVIADYQRGAYGYYGDIAVYNGSADIWMAEPYGPDFSSVNHAINLFNSVQARPIWLAQDNIDANLIVPKAYWAVIGGVTGIQYFTWDLFKADTTKLAAATQAFTELRGLTNAIFGHKMDAYVAVPSGIASMSRFDPGTGSAYILSANSTSQNISGNFMVQGLAAGQPVTVLYENRTITANAGYFSDTFAGVSRHVYSMHSPNTVLTATLASKTGVDASRDWKVQVFNTGLGAANSTQLTNVTFTQTGGPACTPTIAPGTFPLTLGNLAPSESASADVLVNFTGCDSTTKFTVKLIVAANSGATSATVVRNNERK
jgi:hypothetical protein